MTPKEQLERNRTMLPPPAEDSVPSLKQLVHDFTFARPTHEVDVAIARLNVEVAARGTSSDSVTPIALDAAPPPPLLPSRSPSVSVWSAVAIGTLLVGTALGVPLVILYARSNGEAAERPIAAGAAAFWTNATTETGFDWDAIETVAVESLPVESVPVEIDPVDIIGDVTRSDGVGAPPSTALALETSGAGIFSTLSDAGSVTDAQEASGNDRGGAPFDSAAAAASLAGIGANASVACGFEPTGAVRVVVTFAPTGQVTTALLDSGPLRGSVEGSCIARQLRTAKVPAFDGRRTTVHTTLALH